MGYKLLSHDEYQDTRHPPLETLPEVGEHVMLVFQGLEGFRMTETRNARVVESDGKSAVAELLESGMMVAVSAGERIRFTLPQAFTPPLFGDETLLGLDDTLIS